MTLWLHGLRQANLRFKALSNDFIFHARISSLIKSSNEASPLIPAHVEVINSERPLKLWFAIKHLYRGNPPPQAEDEVYIYAPVIWLDKDETEGMVTRYEIL